MIRMVTQLKTSLAVAGILIIIGLLTYFVGNSTMAQGSGDIVTMQDMLRYSQGQYEALAGGGLMIIGLLALLFALLGKGKIPTNITS